MTTGHLNDFAMSVLARGRVTFGDVRRLQRDVLAGGITTREEAETLLSISDRLVRADRAWAQWLAAAVARYLAAEEGAGVEDAGTWLETLLAPSPASTALGRRIARCIRRELAKRTASEPQTPQGAAGEPPPVSVEQPCPAPALQIVRSIACSEIRPTRVRAARPRRKTASPPVLPVEVWSAWMMEKHQRFQLERPWI